MDTQLKEQIAQLYAQMCSGLADPTRIMILYQLAERPHNVGEIAIALALPQPTISRHLKVLRNRRLVFSHREGQTVMYEISDDRIIEAIDILRNVLQDMLASQVSLVNNISELALIEE